MKASVYRAAQKSGALTVPCRAEKTLFSVCLPAFSTEDAAIGLFFFQWQQRSVFMSSLSFPVPGWLFRAGRAVSQQGSHVWAGGALLTVE